MHLPASMYESTPNLDLMSQPILPSSTHTAPSATAATNRPERGSADRSDAPATPAATNRPGQLNVPTYQRVDGKIKKNEIVRGEYDWFKHSRKDAQFLHQATINYKRIIRPKHTTVRRSDLEDITRNDIQKDYTDIANVVLANKPILKTTDLSYRDLILTTGQIQYNVQCTKRQILSKTTNL